MSGKYFSAVTELLGNRRAIALASALCVLDPVWAADSAPAVQEPAAPATSAADAVAAYREFAADHARDYDPTQDISPSQLLILLEVAERTGSNLGQALATGEYESARTWNDFVRPTLGNGSLGSATGVWQFIPSTFHRIIRRYGARMLAASDSSAKDGRARLDLGAGPFSDDQVRRLIQETVDGQRGTDDQKLLLLRHNFAVLAFAKHYLSVETGAKTPVEDYLFHFLGEKRGREVLALARGNARNTLCVKPREEEPDIVEDTGPELASNPAPPADVTPRAILQTASELTTELAMRQPSKPLGTPVDPLGQPRITARQGLTSALQQHSLSRQVRVLGESATFDARVPRPAESAVWSPPPSPRPRRAPPRVSSAWGLSADSAVVTGNLGMFYKDGKGQTRPYTWGEFLDKLAQRVRAERQPTLVRAKYGVGFALKGGDMPRWELDPEELDQDTETFHYETGEPALVSEKLITGTLDAAERRYFKERLAELIRQGEDRPLGTLPPRILTALKHLGALAADVDVSRTDSPEVQSALRAFRKMVGKAPPDDPAQVSMLMPAERVALELYDRRIAHFAALQARQRSAVSQSLDLSHINKVMLKGQLRESVPHFVALQKALASEGLRTQTSTHGLRRGKTGKRAGSAASKFDGIVGTLTLGALERFQLVHGLRPTNGRLDSVTLELMGLPPMSHEIFLPPSGPQCLAESGLGRGFSCGVAGSVGQPAFYDLIPRGPDSLPNWWRSLPAEVEPSKADLPDADEMTAPAAPAPMA